MKCPDCKGKKHIEKDGVDGSNTSFKVCSTCKGTGEIDSVNVTEYFETDEQLKEIINKYPINKGYHLTLIRKQ